MRRDVVGAEHGDAEVCPAAENSDAMTRAPESEGKGEWPKVSKGKQLQPPAYLVASQFPPIPCAHLLRGSKHRILHCCVAPGTTSRDSVLREGWLLRPSKTLKSYQGIAFPLVHDGAGQLALVSKAQRPVEYKDVRKGRHRGPKSSGTSGTAGLREAPVRARVCGRRGVPRAGHTLTKGPWGPSAGIAGRTAGSHSQVRAVTILRVA